MAKKCFMLFMGILCLLVMTNCSKVIKPADKPAYDAAVAAIESAKLEIKRTDISDEKNDLPDLFSTATAHLATAEDFLNQDNYAKALEMASKAATEARQVRELPTSVDNIIAGVEKNLQFAREVGLDKTYGKKIKEINNMIWDAKNNIRLKKYELAKNYASQAATEIKKALDDVESATSELTKAKTALAEAKDAGADVSAADMYKSAEEAIDTAKKEMDNANFNQCADAAKKAVQLAKDALKKAKESKPQQ